MILLARVQRAEYLQYIITLLDDLVQGTQQKTNPHKKQSTKCLLPFFEINVTFLAPVLRYVFTRICLLFFFAEDSERIELFWKLRDEPDIPGVPKLPFGPLFTYAPKLKCFQLAIV